SFGTLMAALCGEPGKLRRAVEEGHEALRDRFCAALSLPAGTTVEDLVAGFCAEGACDENGLRAAAVALAAGSVTDRNRGAALTAWCAEPLRRPQMLE